MTDHSLRKPRRKPKARLHLLESPFPIPIQTITGKSSTNSRWYYYFGHLKSNHVAVFRLGDLTFLYRLGFFGKGMLSKSRPQFEKYNDVLSEHARKQYLCKYSALEPEERELKLLSFAKLQNERLQQHSKWSSNIHVADDETIESGSCGHVEEISQCKDLHTDLDDGLLEETSTDGEDYLDDTDVPNNDKNLILEKEKKEITGDKRPGSSLSKTMPSEKLPKLEDSYKVYEYLQLTFEEAFFLSYGLGCLSVQDDLLYALTLNEMWKEFSCRKENFIEHYIAYHHFRSKGWVARFGNLYGADFLLYKDGMPFYHASYSVFVLLVDYDTMTSSNPNTLDWKLLSSMCRVNEKVAKDVLLCYVVKPKDFNAEDLMSVSCIKRFKVMEVVMRRWIPEKHREMKP